VQIQWAEALKCQEWVAVEDTVQEEAEEEKVAEEEKAVRF
jgi:hypothetical protein